MALQLSIVKKLISHWSMSMTFAINGQGYLQFTYNIRYYISDQGPSQLFCKILGFEAFLINFWFLDYHLYGIFGLLGFSLTFLAHRSMIYTLNLTQV